MLILRATKKQGAFQRQPRLGNIASSTLRFQSRGDSSRLVSPVSRKPEANRRLVSTTTRSRQISRICSVSGSNPAEMDVSGGGGGGGADLRSSIKKWNVIYPVYINSKKTVAEGRRIAAAKACPDPTCIEIADSCAYLKIPRAIELDKAYPRDFFQVGRVRVQLKNDDGTPVNPAIRTKKQLMIQIAELVPKHHGRTKKQEPAASSSAAPTKSKGGKKKK